MLLKYDSVGCYRVSQTVVDDTSLVTCIDTFCVISPTVEASICCSGIACSDCANLEISLSGTPPWDVVIYDGATLDTITGITSSPYVYEVCGQFPSVLQYSIAEVISEAALCPVLVTSSPAEIFFYYPQFPSDWSFATEYDTLLCAFSGMLGYSWYLCQDTTVLSTTECLTIESSGCYCVDMWVFDTCVYTFCEQILVGTEEPISSYISIHPGPGIGQLNVVIQDEVLLPSQWGLYDQIGSRILQGNLIQENTVLDFNNNIIPGLYFIVLENNEYREVRKIIFTN